MLSVSNHAGDEHVVYLAVRRREASRLYDHCQIVFDIFLRLLKAPHRYNRAYQH